MLLNCSRNRLFECMVKQERIVIHDHDKGRRITGWIMAIEMEDSSGYNFNLKIELDDGLFAAETIFVRVPRPEPVSCVTEFC